MRPLSAIPLAALLAGAASAADPPQLRLPVECTLGASCYIQNHVDHDPGPGIRDFACGGLSYDGHQGTDFALPTHLDAVAGVNVLAAAPGRVSALRDGEPDRLFGASDGFAEGRDCGNGVVIDLGAGWEAQYCHMRAGSVAVRLGDTVAAGAVLGQVGMSGNAEFPHLHLSLRHDGQVVDPFQPDAKAACGTDPADQLWLDAPDYAAGGLVSAGFSPGLPDFDHIKWGKAHSQSLPPDAPALVFWALAFGGRKGDEVRLLIDGPAGGFLDQTVRIERNQAQFFRATGRKLGTGNRRPGRYTGTAILIRDGVEVSRISAGTVLE